MREDDRADRPSVNAKMRPSQALFAILPMLIAILTILIGAIADLGWILFLGLLAALAAAVWIIAVAVIIMRNRRRRFHRGFSERTSLMDFLRGR